MRFSMRQDIWILLLKRVGKQTGSSPFSSRFVSTLDFYILLALELAI